MRIFISYRRADSEGYAGRLKDFLEHRFGSDQVFMDVTTVRPGRDFRQEIQKAVGSCNVLIALIGDQWLTLTDDQGRRRLDCPDDLVCYEIQTALERDVLVIPVLVHDASIPRTHELPGVIRSLANRQAVRLRHESFPSDAKRLIEAIEAELKEKGLLEDRAGEAPPSPKPRTVPLQWMVLAGLVVMALVIAALVLGPRLIPAKPTEPMATEAPADMETPIPADALQWDDAADHVGEHHTVCGLVVDTNYAASSEGKPTFLNLGRAYPDPARFTAVIWGDNRQKFPGAPEDMYLNQTICVTGVIAAYEEDGSAQIEVSTPSQIVVVPILSPTPISTVTPTAALTPTADPGCSGYEVCDDFAGDILDGSKWCDIQVEGDAGVGPVIADGVLTLNTSSEIGWVGTGVSACLDGRSIDVVEARVTITEAAASSITGLQARLGYDGTNQWYGVFGIDDQGNFVLSRGLVGGGGEAERDSWPGGDIGLPHLLRIEWIGTAVQFWADGELLTTLEFEDHGGWWFNLSVGALDGGKTTNAFDWVGWNFTPEQSPPAVYDGFDDRCINTELWSTFVYNSHEDELVFLPVPDDTCWELGEWGFVERENLLGFELTSTATDDVELSYLLVEERVDGTYITAVELDLTVDSVGNQADAIGLFTRLNDDGRTWAYYQLRFDLSQQADQGYVCYWDGSEWLQSEPTISLPATVTLKLVWDGEQMHFYLDGEPVLKPLDFKGLSDTFGIYWVIRPGSFLRGHIEEIRVTWR